MPSKGKFTAYQQAYADKPIDVAGNIAKSVDKGVTFAIRKAEQDKKEKELKMANNEKLFGDAAKQIQVQAGAPPSASHVANISGDEIAKIIKNYPPGADRAQRINGIITTANKAINALTAAKGLKDIKLDAYGEDSGWLDMARNLMAGDLSYRYNDEGQLMVYGTYTNKDGVMQSVDMDLDTFADTIKVPDQVQSLNVSEQSEALRQQQGSGVGTIERQNAITTNATLRATQQLNFEDNAVGTVRYLYNNLDLTPEQKTALRDIGAIFQGGQSYDTLNEEQVKLLKDLLPKGIERFSGQMVYDAYGLFPEIKASSGGSSGSGSPSPSGAGSTYRSNTDYINSQISLISTGTTIEQSQTIASDLIETPQIEPGQAPESLQNLAGEGGTVNSTVEKTTINTADGTNVITIDWDIRDQEGFRFGAGGDERTGSGTVTIGGETLKFKNWNELKAKLPDFILGGSDKREAINFYSSGQYLIQQNTNKIVDDLNVNYRSYETEFGVTFGKDKKTGKITILQSGATVGTIDFSKYPIPEKGDSTDTAYEAILQDVMNKRKALVDAQLALIK